jgi:uncharacterized BrkB/YihY/UPF0761 family membrane protein
MGRDSWRYAAQERERTKRKRKNPIWRGVGFVLIVILTLFGYFVAGWFLQANLSQQWIYLPPQVLNPPDLPFLGNGLIVKLASALLFMIFSYGFVTVLYSILFPIKLGETDVPPLRREKTRRR